MNKKILFTTSLALVGLIGFSTIGREAISANAEFYIDHIEQLRFAEKVEDYEYDDEGKKSLLSVESFKNNSSGYIVESITEYYDPDEQALVLDTKVELEYNDKNLVTKKTTSYYNAKDKVWEGEEEENYEYNAKGQQISYKAYYLDGETKELNFSTTSTYNDKGLLSKFVSDSDFGYNETLYTYDDRNNNTKIELYERTMQGDLNLGHLTEIEYDANNDETIEYNLSYNSFTQEVLSNYSWSYTYIAPHKPSEKMFIEYPSTDLQHTNPIKWNKTEITYDGDVVTSIISGKNYGEEDFRLALKEIECDTKELFYDVRYMHNGEEWVLSWGEKTEISWSGDTYLGSKSYNAEDKEGLVWNICGEDVVTYAKAPTPVAGGGFPIGALIGIIVGVIVVVYVVGYVLWKKAVLAFLAKPAFGKAYGWFDKGIVKIGGLFKKK